MTLPAHHMRKIGSGFRRPDPTGGAVAHSHSDRPARSTPRTDPADDTTDGRASGPSAWVLLIGFGGIVLTLGAVILEVISGQYANSAVPGWARWVPLAWPQPLRVAWWLAVAAGAAGFRWSLQRLGLRPSRVVTVCTVVPFLAFAAGIGTGADWATWH